MRRIVLFPPVILLASCSSNQTGGVSVGLPIITITNALNDRPSIMARALASDADIMGTISKINTRFVIAMITDEGLKNHLKSKGLSETSFLASPGLSKFLKSHVLIGQTDTDGTYVALSGDKWDVATNGTNVPMKINGVKLLGYGSVISDYKTDVSKYTSYIVMSNSPIFDIGQ